MCFVCFFSSGEKAIFRKMRTIFKNRHLDVFSPSLHPISAPHLKQASFCFHSERWLAVLVRFYCQTKWVSFLPLYFFTAQGFREKEVLYSWNFIYLFIYLFIYFTKPQYFCYTFDFEYLMCLCGKWGSVCLKKWYGLSRGWENSQKRVLKQVTTLLQLHFFKAASGVNGSSFPMYLRCSCSIIGTRALSRTLTED